MQMFSSVKGLIAKPDIPANNFPVSMVPWTSFDGFNLNLQKDMNIYYQFSLLENIIKKMVDTFYH